MKKTTHTFLFLLFAIVSQAHALNVQLLRPVGDEYEGFSVHGSSTPEAGTFQLGGFINFVQNPIDFDRFGILNGGAVDNFTTLDTYFSLGFFDGFSVGAVLPLNLYTDVVDFNNLTEKKDFSLGDLYLHATLRLTSNKKGIGVALVPFFILPLDIETEDQFNDTAPSAGGNLVIDKHLSAKNYVGLNLGGKYRFQEESVLGSAFEVGHEFLYAASYVHHINASKRIDAFFEAQGSSTFSEFFSQEETMPLEVLLGLKARVFKQSLALTLGGGKGLTQAYGSPDFRAFLGLSYAASRQQANKKEPVESKPKVVRIPMPAPKPVVAPVIKAKTPKSQLVLTLRDENNKLLPVDMEMRNEKGELIGNYSGTTWKKIFPSGNYTLSIHKKNYESITQKLTLKVRKRHTYTLKMKELKLKPGNKLQVLGQIQFESGKASIRPSSYKALNAVAEILKKHDQIELLRIEAYTDSSGSDVINLNLSKKRATSVKSFLLGAGIAQSRLSAIGLGESQPIADNKTAAGRAKNRRVEFTILRASDLKGVKINQ